MAVHDPGPSSLGGERTGPTIRPATILDVPAMVRALPPLETPEGVSATEMSRILRLTLTHVAIEHGIAWLETGDDGEVVGTAIAVPTWQLDGGKELPELLAREAALDTEDDEAVATPIGWVAAIGKAWLIAHPVCHDPGHTGPLLERVVDSASEAAQRDNVPVVLIAARPEDRQAGIDLGFEPLAVAQTSGSIWIGQLRPATLGLRRPAT